MKYENESEIARKVSEHSHVIEAAMSYPIDAIIERYARANDIPMKIAREHERELKRYLALCAINPKVGYGMTGPVDKLWHTFIIFTQEYAKFCDSVARRFLHHVPSQPQAKETEVKAYETFLEDYLVVFGEQAPAETWPRSIGDPEDPYRCNCLYCLRVATESGGQGLK